MTAIGYARVSTADQDLSIQEAALRAAGCEVIRAEKRSGTTTEGREELRTVLEFLRAGDVRDPESFKVRRGKIGGYEDYLSAEDRQYATDALTRLDPRFGYESHQNAPQ